MLLIKNMKIDEESREEIKTFLAKEKPKEFKVFQFTKEMLPKINKKKFKYQYGGYTEIDELNRNIHFIIYHTNEIKGFVRINEYGENDEFEVGDYIAENEEGNYFVIKKEEFENNWILPCGHTIKEHEQFSHLSPEEQEILQHMCGCNVPIE